MTKTYTRTVNSDNNEIVFSFDTTGSMYPCLTQVRRGVGDMIHTLFATLPRLRIGIVAHGDYCDGPAAVQICNLTDNQDRLIQFVNKVPPTGGGDAPECYEEVLHIARDFDWTSDDRKSLVLIGDDVPHTKGYRRQDNDKPVLLDWKNEAKLLVDMGIKIYPVQALGRRHNSFFYEDLARCSGTPKLELAQFSDLADIMEGICYHQGGQLDAFEQSLKTQVSRGERRVSASVFQTLDRLAGRKLSNRSEKVGSRFQVIPVDTDCDIKSFVTSQGLEFKKGRGFYEFTKRETIQEYKDVVAQNIESGAIITGRRARSVLGIPEERADVSPDCATHTGFVQSTSVNRKLKAGTKFLYEIVESAGTEE
jgi:hypothetical protein